MAAVADPGLALIFGAETWRGTPMLVMEFLERGSLADRLRQGPLPVEEALALGARIAGALEVLHQAGILHRDIKPSNIAFTGAGAAKLLDFGLARMLDSERGDAAEREEGETQGTGLSGEETLTQTLRTSAGHLIGTPLYMSPEATMGHSPDPSFDLWGLSLVLYEAIAGRHPLAGENRSGTRNRILEARVADLREARPECSAEVAELFQKALHRRAAYRFQTASALGRRLKELMRG